MGCVRVSTLVVFWTFCVLDPKDLIVIPDGDLAGEAMLLGDVLMFMTLRLELI